MFHILYALPLWSSMLFCHHRLRYLIFRRRLNGGTVAAEIVADDQSDMNSVSSTLSSVTTADFNLALNDQYATDGITDGPTVESLGSPVAEADTATTDDGGDDSSNGYNYENIFL